MVDVTPAVLEGGGGGGLHDGLPSAGRQTLNGSGTASGLHQVRVRYKGLFRGENPPVGVTGAYVMMESFLVMLPRNKDSFLGATR